MKDHHKSISFTTVKRSALDNLINSEILFFKLSDNERITEASNEDNECGMSFELVRTYFEKKFAEQNQKLETKLANDTKQLEKRIKLSKPEELPEFRYKGNKIQYEFNKTLVADLEEVKDLIVEGSMKKSHKKLFSMPNDVSKRNKLIRLADRSPSAWATVAEYMSDDLASDSEDEKRMKAAENRALLNMKSSRKRKYSDGPSYDYDATPATKKPFTKLHASFGTLQIHSRLDPSGRPSLGQQQQRYHSKRVRPQHQCASFAEELVR